MSGSGPTLSPDLEHLLREVAADPEARLLRVAPRDVALGLRTWREQASASMAGLTVAERELVEVHRAEVAWLLAEAALRRFHGDPSSSWRCPYGGTLETEVELHRRLDALSSSQALSIEGLDGWTLLERTASVRSGGPSALVLLEASLRLALDPAVMVYQANQYISLGSFEEAALVTDRVLRSPPDELVTLAAAQALAASMLGLGKLREAWEASLSSARMAESPSVPPGWRSWSGVARLVCGVAIADRGDCETAIYALREEEAELTGWLDGYLAGLEWPADSTAPELASSLRGLVPASNGPLRRLIDALLPT